MNVQSTWHILYYNKAASFAEWKYFGLFPGENEQDAITKSKIEQSQACSAIRVIPQNGGKLFNRGEWEEA